MTDAVITVTGQLHFSRNRLSYKNLPKNGNRGNSVTQARHRMLYLNPSAAIPSAVGNQADTVAAIPHSPKEARKRLSAEQYFEYVEMAIAIRREGDSWQDAEARAFAAILKRMRWPV